MPVSDKPPYLGRLAPSPTGFLHLGHARTFWIASTRAHANEGELLLRNDDLDISRCRPEYTATMLEDLQWLGLDWQPPMYSQSARIPIYRSALSQLHSAGLIYPCHRSRRDVAEAIAAPHEIADPNDEPLFPREWRPASDAPIPPLPPIDTPITTNWRFRVPDDESISFTDQCQGRQTAIAGQDFGDFLVWRRDNMPSYQLACAVDDAVLQITEVVRGADLIKSTFRQLLIFRALAKPPPSYYHCPLMADSSGQRLAKRHDALSLRTLRAQGTTPEMLINQFEKDLAG